MYSATSKYRPGRFALKRIHPSKSSNSLSLSFYREIVVLRQITHQNLVPLLEIVTSKFSAGSSSSSGTDSATTKVDGHKKSGSGPTFVKGDLYMVFEYMDHDLAGLLNAGYKFSVPQIRCLMHQLLEVLDYLHTKKQLMHRDIKSSNLLVGENMQLKLADFGLARFANREDGRYTNRVITLWYRPPELLLGEEHYSFSVDIWSVGCIMAELLLGFPAFQAKNEVDQLESIWSVCGTPTEDNWPDHKKLPMWNNPYTPKHLMGAQMSAKWEKNIAREIKKRRVLFESRITEINGTGGSTSSSSGHFVDAGNNGIESSSGGGSSGGGGSVDSIGVGYGDVSELGSSVTPSESPGESGATPSDMILLPKDAGAETKTAIKLLERLLALDPLRRFSARAAKDDDFFTCDPDSLHWQNLDIHQQIGTGGSFHEWETKQMLKELPPGTKSKDRKLLVQNKLKRPRPAAVVVSERQDGDKKRSKHS